MPPRPPTPPRRLSPLAVRVVFYGGNVFAAFIFCQDFVRRLSVTLLGDDAGDSLYRFVRTNVEAPVSALVLGLFLDLVLRRRPAPTADEVAADGASSTEAAGASA